MNNLTVPDPSAPTLSFSIYTNDTTSSEFFAFDGTNYYTDTFNATTNTFKFDSRKDFITTAPATLGEALDDGEHIDIGNGNNIDSRRHGNR